MSNDTIIGIIIKVDIIVKLVLIILFGFSVVSWAIIFYKFRFLSKIEKESEKFHRIFISNKNLSTLYQFTAGLKLNPLFKLFNAVYHEIDKDKITIEEIKIKLKRIESIETISFEKYLTFLATTGSTTPFIGLFGTVWGIMNAFRSIGRIGSASLAVVAPGIAEALIATAAGLAAAIPAVIAYNYFVNKVRKNITTMEDFSSELIGYFIKNYGKTKNSSVRD